MKKTTFDFFANGSIPAGWDIDGKTEDSIRIVKQHNAKIAERYRANLKNIKNGIDKVAIKMMQTTEKPLPAHEYEKIERQFSQLKSAATLLLKEPYDAGIIINGVPNTEIENAYKKGIIYYEKVPDEIDTHLQVLAGLMKMDKKAKVIKKEFKELSDCFQSSDDYHRAIALLQNTKPCIIDKNMNYCTGERKKIAISEWINLLIESPDFSFSKPDDKTLVTLLNNAFAGLNMGADGRTLDNKSSQWSSKLKAAK